MCWAELNWEKLEAQARKEDNDSRALYGDQLGAYRMQAEALNSGTMGINPLDAQTRISPFANPEAIRQANWQGAHDHNQGRDPFLWP